VRPSRQYVPNDMRNVLLGLDYSAGKTRKGDNQQCKAFELGRLMGTAHKSFAKVRSPLEAWKGPRLPTQLPSSSKPVSRDP
jgi:hypothetical protein